MLTALRVELLKTRTTRTWWVLLALLAGFMALITAFLAFSFTLAGDAAPPGAPSLEDSGVQRALHTLALPFGYAFPALLGVLAITTEHRYRTLTPTYLAQPRRGAVMAAKVTVSLLLGLLAGVVGLAACSAAASAVLAANGIDTPLGDRSLWVSLSRACLGMGLWSVVGVGVGALVRNQVAAIVGVLAVSQFVEPLLRFGLSAVDSLAPAARVLPSAAGEAMTGGSLFGAAAGGPAVDLLEWWQGALVLGGYALVLCLLGTLSAVRRDVG